MADTNERSETRRGAWRIAVALVFLATLALYVYGSAPTVLFDDGAELQAVGLAGGVPRASGYPTFVLISRVFGLLPLGEPAHRITLASSFFGAVSVALLMTLMRTLGLSLGAAVVSASAYALSFTFLRAGFRAEVYTLAITIALLAFARVVIAMRTSSLRDGALAAFLLGLTLTGHLCFVAPVAVLGAALLVSLARRVPRAPWRALVLPLVFVAGFAPYLYLVWADSQPGGYDYLRIVQTETNPFHTPDARFDTPWERVAWLVTGRNHYPPVPATVGWKHTVRNAFPAGADLALFELGPIGAALALVGLLRRRGMGREHWLFAIAAGSSFLFASAYGNKATRTVMLIPCVLITTIFVANALDGFARRTRGALARAGFAVFAVAAITLPAHALRLHADRHPIWSFRTEEKGVLHARGWLPTMRGYDEPRRYGEGAMAAIPRDAIVLGRWGELTNLRYFQVVEHRRLDLTIEPMDGFLQWRVLDWQRRYGLSARPAVFLSRPVQLEEPCATNLDSLAAAGGRWLYVQRQPLLCAPSPIPASWVP